MTTREEAIRLAREAWFSELATNLNADMFERLITLAKNDAYREAAEKAKIMTASCAFQTVEHYRFASACESAILALVKEE